jgi:eukaryotic-like serine/threonine-protein kinase
VASPVREGDVLAGKYRVTRIVAQGGMGIVVAARHLKLQQEVALKLMLPELLDHPEAAGRFLREARAAARLKSEHAARILDICELDSGLPYIVMELLEGDDLATLLPRFAPFPLEDAVDYVIQACEAVAEAHALGIVHRDLKPENLFLCTRRDGAPLVKVLDFGISKVTGGPDRASCARVTTREAMGSPSYMSPEQMRSTRDVDGRADLWSLGVILYELVTGRQPFTGMSIAEVCLAVTQDPPPPLGLPNAPEGFEAVVSRCLAKDPGDRFACVADLVRALAPYAPRRSQALIASMLAGAGVPGDEPSEPVWPLTVRPRERSTLNRLASHRKLILAAAGALLLGVIGSIRLATRGTDAPSPPVVRDDPGAGREPGPMVGASTISPSPAVPGISSVAAANGAESAPPPFAPAPVTSRAPAGVAPASKGAGSRARNAASGTGRAPSGAGPSDDVFSVRK